MCHELCISSWSCSVRLLLLKQCSTAAQEVCYCASSVQLLKQWVTAQSVYSCHFATVQAACYCSNRMLLHTQYALCYCSSSSSVLLLLLNQWATAPCELAYLCSFSSNGIMLLLKQWDTAPSQAVCYWSFSCSVLLLPLKQCASTPSQAVC